MALSLLRFFPTHPDKDDGSGHPRFGHCVTISPRCIAGHDIGLTVAYAYAAIPQSPMNSVTSITGMSSGMLAALEVSELAL